MRVYNGTNSQLDLPLSGIQRITIPAKSVSGDIMPSTEFLSLLVSSYDYSEVALIVSGPFELNLCASVSGSVGYVVQSLEEAIERFSVNNKKTDLTTEENIENSKCNTECDSCTECSSEIIEKDEINNIENDSTESQEDSLVSEKKKKVKKN